MSNEELSMEVDIITLTLDDDTEVECEVIGIFEAEGREYIAMVPVEEDEESDLYIYRYSEDEEGNPVLDNIESDEEFEKCMEFMKKMEFADAHIFSYSPRPGTPAAKMKNQVSISARLFVYIDRWVPEPEQMAGGIVL